MESPVDLRANGTGEAVWQSVVSEQSVRALLYSCTRG